MLSLKEKEEVKIMQVEAIIAAAVYIGDDHSMYVKKAQNNRKISFGARESVIQYAGL